MIFPTELKRDGVHIVYTPGFVHPSLCSRLFDALRSELAWEQPRVRVFGREHPVPRLVAYHADPGCRYGYSGLQHEPQPWTPALEEIRALVQAQHGPQHAVLANLYKDGRSGMGAHADDERELDPDAPILMVSLGASRDFVLKHRRTQARHVISVLDGSLLEMRGRTNRVALHSLPKTARRVGARISLTFRRMREG